MACNLILRNLKEMMAERSIDLEHSTVHRWVLYFSPKLLERFNRRKGPVTRKWNLDETYIKVHGEWLSLYRAIDSNGDTVEFYFSKDRDLTAAKRFLRKALARHGRPERITIDGSQTNRTSILQCDAGNRLRQRRRANRNGIFTSFTCPISPPDYGLALGLPDAGRGCKG
ncbi:IS6 family transposase [Brucella sp. BE17]|uniref:IS6 family transposase n=1 Tax=Brucella sp. BE17 TaxID=3142977 RepID=UPI0031BA03E6